MNRRTFIKAIASLPIVGGLVAVKPEIPVTDELTEKTLIDAINSLPEWNLPPRPFLTFQGVPVKYVERLDCNV